MMRLSAEWKVRAVRFIGSFSSSFILALLIWPFISLALTVPVLAMLYHRDNRIRLSSALSSYAVVLYLIGLLCFTLYPIPDDPQAYCATHHLLPQLNPVQFIADIRSAGLAAVMQIVMNIVFFVPLGFIMGRVFRWRLIAALPVAFAVSLTVEVLQLTGLFGRYPCAYRLFDVDDLLWNTAGAMIGFGAAALMSKVFPISKADTSTTKSPGFIRRCVAFAVDMGIIMVVALPGGLLVTVLYRYVVSGPDERWRGVEVFGGFTLVSLVALIAMVVFEGVVPWMRQGRTWGGSYTHMTIETRERTGMRRVCFYVVRLVVLGVVVFGGDIPHWPLLMLGLGLFWLVARKMPYDLI